MEEVDEDSNGEIDFEEFSEGLLMIDSTLMKSELEEVYSHCTWSKDSELKISSFLDILKSNLLKNYPIVKVNGMKKHKIVRKAFPKIFAGKANIVKIATSRHRLSAGNSVNDDASTNKSDSGDTPFSSAAVTPTTNENPWEQNNIVDVCIHNMMYILETNEKRKCFAFFFLFCCMIVMCQISHLWRYQRFE